MITYDIDVLIGGEYTDRKIPMVKCHDTGVNFRTHLNAVEKATKWKVTEKPYFLPEGATAVIKLAKPDGCYVYQDGTCEATSVLFEVPSQSFTVPGIVKAEVNVFKNGKRITSADFCINVPKEVADECSEDSEPYVSIMGEQIEEAVSAAERAEMAADKTQRAADLAAESANSAKNAADSAVHSMASASADAITASEAATAAAKSAEYAQEAANASIEAVVEMKTTDGTVVSPNADFAEVAEWADGNPNNEDRTGYFVCANVPVNGIIMKKATSMDDVKGVTILSPAFAGNYTKDKLDGNGKLLPKYSFVAIIGFVPVIDNGTCTVGGRCMPDDNGCAIPSTNSMGYQVVNRIDEKRVLIIIEPNGDMVQRVKTKINKLQEDVDNLEKAFADVGGGAEYETIIDGELAEGGVSLITTAMADIRQYTRLQFFVDAKLPALSTATNCAIRLCVGDEKSVSYSSYIASTTPNHQAETTYHIIGSVEIMVESEDGKTWLQSNYSASKYSALNSVGNTSGAINDIRSERIESCPPYFKISVANNTFMAGTRYIVKGWKR